MVMPYVIAFVVLLLLLPLLRRLVPVPISGEGVVFLLLLGLGYYLLQRRAEERVRDTFERQARAPGGRTADGAGEHDSP